VPESHLAAKKAEAVVQRVERRRLGRVRTLTHDRHALGAPPEP
jgi:hypothetical protein